MASLMDLLRQGQAPTLKDIPANWDGRTTAQPAKTWLQDQGNYLANFGRQAMETLDPGIGLASQIGADAGRGNYASAAMGLPLLAMSVAPGPAPKPKGITAYHGSPHDFDKFDLSKIGTGEGAQAYGHGLYFAENEGVARSYRDALQSKPALIPAYAETALDMFGGDTARALAYAKQRAQTGDSFAPKKGWEDAAKYLETGDASASPGRMYEVRINADPEQFLDWDLQLSQQSDEVRQWINDLPVKSREAQRFQNEAMLGEDIVTELSRLYPEKQDASTMLREAGIPGIRYLDQGSRTAGEGSRNYVVFDDALVEILRKYGLIPGAYAGASLADTLTSADEPQY